jgi:hypothetical protein
VPQACQRDALPVAFAGACAALVGVAVLSLIVMSFIHFPPVLRHGSALPA